MVKQLYKTELEKRTTFQLEIHSILFNIWTLLFDHAPKIIKSNKKTYPHLSALKGMISFIHSNYSQKITLEDISTSGNVCKSSCYQIFKEYLHQTPIGYLNDFRLNKSIELLKNSNMNIAEISYATGFSGSSYFTETFKKSFGITPSHYRKNWYRTWHRLL